MIRRLPGKQVREQPSELPEPQRHLLVPPAADAPKSSEDDSEGGLWEQQHRHQAGGPELAEDASPEDGDSGLPPGLALSARAATRAAACTWSLGHFRWRLKMPSLLKTSHLSWALKRSTLGILLKMKSLSSLLVASHSRTSRLFSRR
mmetsp:Transcript_164245/g.399200  ORF Transcript_164245/g.399200 Transcript_164245/m.399200 type:complete len:147 (-) Transcript_164245:87-527(-)